MCIFEMHLKFQNTRLSLTFFLIDIIIWVFVFFFRKCFFCYIVAYISSFQFLICITVSACVLGDDASVTIEGSILEVGVGSCCSCVVMAAATATAAVARLSTHDQRTLSYSKTAAVPDV